MFALRIGVQSKAHRLAGTSRYSATQAHANNSWPAGLSAVFLMAVGVKLLVTERSVAEALEPLCHSAQNRRLQAGQTPM